MEYLLKASAVIAVFYLCFYIFLKKETFFNHNRWFLLFGLMIALVFPLIVIPIYIPIEPITIPETLYTINENATNTMASAQTESVFEWISLIPIIYAIGFSVLFIQFLLQFGSLIMLLIQNPKNKDGIYTYVIVENKISPFSFFKWIVYNPENYNKDELQLILIHEKVHANQMHSIDILFTQLACVIFWFNPLIWLYRKEVRQNLEYIADFKTQSISKNEKEYQHLLLKTSVVNHNISISNNFYNSLIKERIVMLKKSRSNTKKQLRYLFMLPLLAGLLISMNTENVYIEEGISTLNSENAIESIVTQNTTDSMDKINDKEKTKILGKRDHKAIQNDEDFKSFEQERSNYENQKNNKKVTPSKTLKVASAIKPIADRKETALVTPQKHLNKPQFLGDISFTIITKNTTDSELDNIKDDLKKEGLTAKFKGVKRNKNGEITAIKINVKSNKSNASYNVNSEEAIDPVKIIYNEGKNSISIGNGHSAHGENTFLFESKSGNHQIHKSGSGSNVFVISDKKHEHDEEHDINYIVKSNFKKGNVKRIKSSKTIEVISGDDNELIEIIIDEDDTNDLKETIIVNGGKIKVVEGKENIVVNGKKYIVVEGRENIVVKEKAKNVWVSNHNIESDVIILKNVYDKNNVFFSDDGDKNPLFILDGKEVTKDQFANLKPDSIESVTVLKDKSAIKKYGEKAKDGVIIIKTKKKN